jgi:cyanophycinase
MNKIPKGKLLIIGGAEDKGDNDNYTVLSSGHIQRLEILNLLIPPHKDKGIEIITTASSIPDQICEMYEGAFKKIGFKKVGFINMSNHPDASNPLFIGRIKKSHAVLFSGGDQFRLSTILGNTDVLRAVKEKYMEDADFIVAGTSAGAMAAATLMMFEGVNTESMLKGAVKISSGLGFLEGCIIDTHFTSRGRFGRLSQAIVMNPTCVGIGLSENTALLIKHGRDSVCIGTGMVIVIDGRNVNHTNIAYADTNEALCIENLKVDILCEGNGYLMDERQFIPAKKDVAKERSTEVKTINAEGKPQKKSSTKKSAVKKTVAKKTTTVRAKRHP